MTAVEAGLALSSKEILQLERALSEANREVSLFQSLLDELNTSLPSGRV